MDPHRLRPSPGRDGAESASELHSPCPPARNDGGLSSGRQDSNAGFHAPLPPCSIPPPPLGERRCPGAAGGVLGTSLGPCRLIPMGVCHGGGISSRGWGLHPLPRLPQSLLRGDPLTSRLFPSPSSEKPLGQELKEGGSRGLRCRCREEARAGWALRC